MSAWYRAGSVSVTNGSVSVVGVDTLWASQAAVGDAFSIDGDKLYEIAAITDNTHLTLQSAYTGTTAGVVSYGIIRNFTGTTQAELAASLAELLNSWQTREDQYRNWQTGTATGGTAGDGAYPITDILGNTYSYYSPAKLNKIASGLFGHNTSTTTGLTLGYLGGVMLVDGVITTIADGTLVLSASSTNYVEATRAGVVSKNTTGFTAGRIPIREVVTGTAAITSIAERLPRDVPVIGRLSKSVAGNTDVTLTAAEARNQVMEFTGALTGNISVIIPAVASVFVIGNSTSGSYTLTAKTAAGTGVAVMQGKRALMECDGTNVVNAFTSVPGIGAADIANIPANNIAATTVQAAINELDAEKAKLAGDSAQDFTVKNLTSTGNVTLGDSAADIHAVNGPIVFNHGFTIGGQSVTVSNIGVAGTAGFGVGICPTTPAGMFPLSNGTFNPFDADYGNYIYTDGSIMVWIPAFYYKYGTGSNGLAVNAVDIKQLGYFVTAANSPFKSAALYADEVTAANAAGYAIHRAFYDGGALKYGVFVDKYKCSNNAGTASSIKNGNPLSSNAANNPFSGLTGAPANAYYGAIAAAKTRGASFFPGSLFINKAIALLSYAHAQASTSTTWCAWYHATNNFPKGCNNNALSDAQDATLTFTSTGNETYPTANKTGSASVLAKTTHNGQACGVADVNGTLWEICLGLTSDGTNYYILKTSVAMKDITAGTTLATDAWGATGIAALYDNLGTTYGALWATGANRIAYYGSASQVFSEVTSGNAWNASGAGVPLAAGIGGANTFGNDRLTDYKPNLMCPLVSGHWPDSSNAGAWALSLSNVRSNSSYYVGLRAALYL